MPTSNLPDAGLARKLNKHWSESAKLGSVAVVVLLLVSLALWLQYTQSASRLRAETATQVELRAEQVASATASAVSILFQAVDVASRDLARTYAESGARGFEQQVLEVIERLPAGAVLQVAVIDSQGFLVYSNLGPSEKVFLGDREHFKAHTQGGDSLFISKPVLGRVSKQWSIQFSRPILKGEQFGGVLVMSVSPSYLQAALAGVALKSDDAISVLRQSGELLARNRDMEPNLGKPAAPGRAFLAAEAQAKGVYTAHSPIDNTQRLYQWQRLPGYPIVVLLGLSTETAFAPVERVIREDRFKVLAGLAAAWIVAFAMAMLTKRIGRHKHQREQMEFVAMSDSLTGLGSRHALMGRFEDAIASAGSAGKRVGILYMDLDGFKPVNDRYGHAAGDEVLVAVGKRIKACIRSDDFAARIGGDEFVILVGSLENEQTLSNLADRITGAIDAPIAVAGTEVSIRASVGKATFPMHGDSVDALLAHADHEMYRLKSQKPGKVPEPAMNA